MSGGRGRPIISAISVALLTAAVAGLLAGCVSFRPKPIEPARAEEAFRGRTLSERGLREFVEANLPERLPAWPPESWDLETLTLIALYFHPDLDVARARVGIAEAETVTARARPNPSMSTDAGHADGSPAGVSPWILGFAFDLPVETAGKRGYRSARAGHLVEAARLDLAEAGWRVRSALRAALVEHLLAAREAELLRAEAVARREAVDLLEKRLSAGEVSRPDVDAGVADLAGTELAIRSADGRVTESRATLASALGLPESAIRGASLSWSAIDAPPAEESLDPAALQAAGLLNRLEVPRMLAEYAAAESALQLEVAKQRPDVHLGPGYLWDQGQNKFSIGLSISLPIFNRNEGPIAEAEAHRREVGARFVALQARIIGETERALAAYRAALSELRQADLSLVEIQARREKALRRAVEIGEGDRLALAGIRVQGAVLARARLEALRRAQRSLGAFEDAVQRPLDSTASPIAVPPESPREASSKETDR